MVMEAPTSLALPQQFLPHPKHSAALLTYPVASLLFDVFGWRVHYFQVLFRSRRSYFLSIRFFTVNYLSAFSGPDSRPVS